MTKARHPSLLSETEINLRREEIRIGKAAEQLLESEIFKKVAGEIKEEIVSEFWDAPLRDDDGLVKLRLMAKAVQGFTDRLADKAATGKLAEKQLDDHREAGGSV